MALSLGIPVGELKDRITANELNLWRLYERHIGKIGNERTDYLFASICSAIHQLIAVIVASNGGDNCQIPTIEECLLQFTKKETKQHEIDIIKQIEMRIPDNPEKELRKLCK